MRETAEQVLAGEMHTTNSSELRSLISQRWEQ